MRRMMAVALCALMAGCTPPAVAVQTVREAGPEDVAGCALIGQVTGVPGVYDPLAKVGLADARKAAKRTALEQGANTVVFDTPVAGEPVYQVSGAAYRC